MNRLQAAYGKPGEPLANSFHQPEQGAFRLRKTVLLAEDDSDLRYVLEYSLISMGYLVVAAADAYLASAAFRSHAAIDLLLSDYEMPGRTGVELARELTGLRPSLPVMIITGSILQPVILTEINERNWTYVSKPCHLGALEASLKRLLTTKELSAANFIAA